MHSVLVLDKIIQHKLWPNNVWLQSNSAKISGPRFGIRLVELFSVSMHELGWGADIQTQEDIRTEDRELNIHRCKKHMMSQLSTITACLWLVS